MLCQWQTAAAAEFSSWISPAQNNFITSLHMCCNSSDKTFFSGLIRFSSLKKWSTHAIRRQMFIANERMSIIPVIEELKGELPKTLIPVVRLDEPVKSILSINRCHKIDAA